MRTALAILLLAFWLGAGLLAPAQTRLGPTMSVTIAPNDPGLLYSPYTWWANGSTDARANNPGAYLRTVFSGTSAALTFDTSPNTTPFPIVAVNIDGTGWTRYTVAASVSVATGLVNREHSLEMVLEATSELQDRWTTPVAIIRLTGLTLDTGAAVRLPTRRKYNVLVYGDSTSEGIRTIGDTGGTGTLADNSAVRGWPLALGHLLDAEIGIVGFGGSGVTVTGSGNVPPLTTSYTLLWSGQSRVFSPSPDLIVYLEGQNDAGAAGVTSGLETVITALLTTAPNAKQLVLRPLSGVSAAQVQAAVSGMANARVVYGDTTGWITSGTDTSDGIHPYDYADQAFVAPDVAALALALTVAPNRFPFG